MLKISFNVQVCFLSADVEDDCLTDSLATSTNQTYISQGNVIELNCSSQQYVVEFAWQYGDFTISPCKVESGDTPDGTEITLIACSLMSDREFNIIVRIDTMGTDEGTWVCNAIAIQDDFPLDLCAMEPIWKHSRFA